MRLWKIGAGKAQSSPKKQEKAKDIEKQGLCPMQGLRLSFGVTGAEIGAAHHFSEVQMQLVDTSFFRVAGHGLDVGYSHVKPGWQRIRCSAEKEPPLAISSPHIRTRCSGDNAIFCFGVGSAHVRLSVFCWRCSCPSVQRMLCPGDRS